MQKENKIPKRFIPIDVDLFNNPKYHTLSNGAKLVYSVYSSRFRISFYHYLEEDYTYYDAEKGLFIYFANEDLARILNVSTRSITNYKRELLEFGLIEVQDTKNNGHRIYVKDVEPTPIDLDKEELAMPYFAIDEEGSSSKETENDSVVMENFSNVKAKKILLSNEKLKIKNITYDSGTGYIPNNNSTQPQTNSSLRDLSVESIGNRIKNQISTPVFAKIKMLAQNSYEKIKFYADTIFKAKSQVMSRLLNNPNWLYRQEFQEATRFESNLFLADGLEKSLLKLAEIMYKSDNEIRSEERLSYVYLRNGLANSTKKYLLDNFEFSDDERYQITQALAF
ncbi:replication protein [Ligilactobacillus salivarius]|uniref:Putative replication protein n=1 Tax=Ligilactobacillus salivarius SMXD51 TaxID=1108963 RepID=H7G1G9_9LACO|nr:replication initiator protein A [Ligilactobacillus salivarius]EIA31794.1 putative replication protein [Ligilactobacillus salivarius SMXD51]OQR12774.1 replication protein [Ligilactobacillus salivarius]